MAQQKKDVIGLLKCIPSFEAFTEDELAEIAEMKSIFKSFNKGDLIIRQGDMEATVCILMLGQASIRKKERPDVEIVSLTPGQIFGEMTYILKISRSTDVVAKTNDVMVLVLDDEMLEKLSPVIINKFKDAFLLVMAKRLVDMNEKLSSLKLEVKGLIQAHDQLVSQINSSTKNVIDHLADLNMSMSDLVE